jgi:hypothetical protein
MKVEEVFKNELAMIKDQDIKDFVIECFKLLCPDYFWTVPCSTSGKYHPQISLGEGGLIRHVKLAVWWGLELMKAMSANAGLKNIPTLQDEIIATLLLHDIIKNGEGLGADGRPLDRSVTGTHGVILAEKIQTINIYLDNDDVFYRILTGIALHMGIWTTKIYSTIDCTGLDPFVDLIHLADYCASRKVDEMFSVLESEKIE